VRTSGNYCWFKFNHSKKNNLDYKCKKIWKLLHFKKQNYKFIFGILEYSKNKKIRNTCNYKIRKTSIYYDYRNKKIRINWLKMKEMEDSQNYFKSYNCIKYITKKTFYTNSYLVMWSKSSMIWFELINN